MAVNSAPPCFTAIPNCQPSSLPSCTFISHAVSGGKMLVWAYPLGQMNSGANRILCTLFQVEGVASQP
jgi:hypothetical protein